MITSSAENLTASLGVGRLRLFNRTVDVRLSLQPTEEDFPAPADLTIQPAEGHSAPPTPTPARRSFTYQHSRPYSLSSIDRTSHGLTLTFGAAGTFAVAATTVTFWPGPMATESRLLGLIHGPVMACWLELTGTPVFHGGCVNGPAGSIGLLGPSGAGKSTLLCSFLKAGYEVLADDQLVFAPDLPSPRPLAALPLMKISEGAAKYLGYDARTLPALAGPAGAKRLLPLDRMPTGQPLRCIVVLDRSTESSPLKISALSTLQAFAALDHCSSATRSIQIGGLRSCRLGKLSAFACQIPFYRVSYPTGFNNLDLVRNGIIGSPELTKRRSA